MRDQWYQAVFCASCRIGVLFPYLSGLPVYDYGRILKVVKYFFMENNYNNMTLVQLRALAKERGMKGITVLKKDQLIERLIKEDAGVVGTAGPGETPKESADPGRDEDSRSARTLKQIDQTAVKKDVSPAERSQPAEPVRQADRPGAAGDRRRRPTDRIRTASQPAAEEDQLSEADRKQQPLRRREAPQTQENGMKAELASLDSGAKADGILEVMPDGYGFIRCENYLPGENDVYVSPSQIRRFNMKTGDILVGNIRVKTQNEKYSALLYVESINGLKPYEAQKRKNFEDLTPIFPNHKITLEYPGAPISMRMVDLLSPIGRGQRGMIVSQPKTGKTTLIKQIARSIITNCPDMKVIILLIDERPEEVTDIREYIEGPNAEVIYSTFDELPEHHRRVSEMVLERAKRLVEHKQDVVILLDSITRLARAYNLIVPPSGRTLSGGLDPAALHMPKKFFGAARNMREGGSLTVLATALVDTGSKMDDVVFEEFKGTGNMELVLDRKLSEKRIFPAINIQRSGTRRDDLLLTKEEQEVVFALHRELSGTRTDENMEQILTFFKKTKNNQEFIELMQRSLLNRR